MDILVKQSCISNHRHPVMIILLLRVWETLPVKQGLDLILSNYHFSEFKSQVSRGDSWEPVKLFKMLNSYHPTHCRGKNFLITTLTTRNPSLGIV